MFEIIVTLGLAAFGRGEAVFLNYEEEMHDE